MLKFSIFNFQLSMLNAQCSIAESFETSRVGRIPNAIYLNPQNHHPLGPGQAAE